MKTTVVTPQEFSMIMYRTGGVLRFKDSDPTHATLTYCRDVPSKYGYKQVRDIGWSHAIQNYCGNLEYTFTVPTFLYEAYIK